MSCFLYIIRDSLRTRQINPVVHQAHAGFVLPRHKVVSTIAVYRPFILNLHTISLIKAVFNIGENTPERLQCLTLGGNNQIAVNAPLQKQQCFILLFCFRNHFCELPHNKETAGTARCAGGKGQYINQRAVADALGHAKSIITVETYTDKKEIIKGWVNEIQPFIDEVHPYSKEDIRMLKEHFDIILEPGIV